MLGQARFIAVAAFFLLVDAGELAVAGVPGRDALVVGNKSYATAPLKNTVNDASAMAAELESIGFDVTLLIDVTKAELVDGVADFYESVERAESAESLAVFYYAGHAVQINHRNFLVPLDAGFEKEAALLAGIFDLNDLLGGIPQSTSLQHVVILDACRNNPIDAGATSRSVPNARGLAPMRAPPGTLIAYATEPGNVADDGAGEHGTYTKYLLRHLDRRVKVEEVFMRVRRDVVKATGGMQTPWEHSSLLSDAFFNPPRNRNLPEVVGF